ncbi:hypothetical protein ABIB90_008304 [Bradyrhizobium sp. JR4.1]|nr:hypothetical protein Bra1253DRAFT_07188 [Bradyrhizobium sp. WSM1253]
MFSAGGFVSIQSIGATISERELAARGVQSLRHSDCMEIVENLLVRLKALDQELAARNKSQAKLERETIPAWGPEG